MLGDILTTAEIYDFILSEGDLRGLLAKMETLRKQNNKPYCVRIHLEPAGNGQTLSRNSIEPLTKEIIEMIRKDLDF